VHGAQYTKALGYLVEQELGNRLLFDKPLASLLTMIEVDPERPGLNFFQDFSRGHGVSTAWSPAAAAQSRKDRVQSPAGGARRGQAHPQ